MYKILARKYRPKCFSEVVEQEHVTRTLMRAIKTDRVGHAYLFSGPRGVGKTTIARVLVKTLNCSDLNKDTLDCCGTCQFCSEVDKGISLDYQEIDGASHRGIDQIREIKNNLPYASANQNYRVFVIDEVHMLTSEAFNAMLKSLEEPPSKVIFILCTTESGKIPLTIRSRCQHFRFKLLSLKKLQTILSTITTKENIDAEQGALFYIAKHAAGSIRDAQNLLEQVAAYAGDKITQDKTLIALGEVSKQVLYDFVSQLQQNALAKNYLLIEELIAAGGSFNVFLYELVSLFSTFIYLQEGLKETHLLSMSVEDIKLFYDLSHRFERHELYKLLDCLFEFIQELKYTTEEKTIRNLTLIKLHRYKTLITSEEIQSSLNLLAQASDLTGGAAAKTTPSQSVSQPQPTSQPQPVSQRIVEKSSPPVKTPSPPAATNTSEKTIPPLKQSSLPEDQDQIHSVTSPFNLIGDIKTVSHTAESVAAQKKLAPNTTPLKSLTERPDENSNETPKKPSANHKPVQSNSVAAASSSKPLIIETWDETTYRSLLRWAMQNGDEIYQKLNKFQFERYDNKDELLQLLLIEPLSYSQSVFKAELITYLKKQTSDPLVTIKLPVRAIAITPSIMLKNTENVTSVFKDAKRIEE
ncbi:DNA polymerase III subunit gamma/tau [Spirochaetota bacterium]|nr:DNA polymerase III subunit gamma/tau [Spirochaetota bacterium]